MATKLGRMVTYLEGLTTIKSHNILITWSCKAMWQTKIIISLLPKCLWPQTCQDGSSPWLAANHKVMQNFDHVVLSGHVTNKNHYISITREPWASKLGRIMTSFDGPLPTMSHNSLITWPRWIQFYVFQTRLYDFTYFTYFEFYIFQVYLQEEVQHVNF